jgi:hypothetical protein
VSPSTTTFARRIAGFLRRLVLPLVGWGLAVFHAGLLWVRIDRASFDDPAILLRWLGAAGLVGGAYLWKRRTRSSLTSGRGALVFWTLVALLHAGAPLPAVEAHGIEGAALALVLVALFAARVPERRVRAVAHARPEGRAALLATLGAGPLSAPRPPPSFFPLR